MKQPVIPYKTDKQIEEEITNILNGHDHSTRGQMLRKAAHTLTLTQGLSQEQIRDLFIAEYKKKYGDLQTGKKSLEQIKKESIAEAKQAGDTLK